MIEQNLNSWVMNVVPVSGPNTLPVIYDRGLIGVMHDWYVSQLFLTAKYIDSQFFMGTYLFYSDCLMLSFILYISTPISSYQHVALLSKIVFDRFYVIHHL